jgi:hypothetical protein
LKGHIVVIDWGLTANLILRGEKNKYVLTCRDYQVLLVRGPGFCYDSICDFAYLLDLGFFVIASGDIHVTTLVALDVVHLNKVRVCQVGVFIAHFNE